MKEKKRERCECWPVKKREVSGQHWYSQLPREWKRDVCWQLTVSFTIKIRPYSSSTANIFLDDCGLMAVEGYGLDSEGVTRLLLENLESRVLPLLSWGSPALQPFPYLFSNMDPPPVKDNNNADPWKRKEKRTQPDKPDSSFLNPVWLLPSRLNRLTPSVCLFFFISVSGS